MNNVNFTSLNVVLFFNQTYLRESKGGEIWENQRISKHHHPLQDFMNLAYNMKNVIHIYQ